MLFQRLSMHGLIVFLALNNKLVAGVDPTGLPSSTPTSIPTTTDSVLHYTTDYGNNSCYAKGHITPNDCYAYRQSQLLSLIGDQSRYTPDLMARNADRSPLEVSLTIYFDSLINADQLAGTITINLELSMGWLDPRLGWDYSYTVDQYGDMHHSPFEANSLQIPADQVWTPHLDMFNSAQQFTFGFYQQLSDIKTYVYKDGSQYILLKGVAVAQCDFDVTDFPFDTQNCTMYLGHPFYYNDELKIHLSYRDHTLYPIEYPTFGDGFMVSRDFSSSAWEFMGMESAPYSDYHGFDCVQFDIHFRRHPTYLISMAIVPLLLVTVTSYIALYIPDPNTRVATAVTCLLTIMAVQWSFTSNIPATAITPWISKLSIFCMIYVATICSWLFFLSWLNGSGGASEVDNETKIKMVKQMSRQFFKQPKVRPRDNDDDDDDGGDPGDNKYVATVPKSLERTSMLPSVKRAILSLFVIEWFFRCSLGALLVAGVGVIFSEVEIRSE